jgi:hypothetical protein
MARRDAVRGTQSIAQRASPDRPHSRPDSTTRRLHEREGALGERTSIEALAGRLSSFEVSMARDVGEERMHRGAD